jgi:hypothetical protein
MSRSVVVPGAASVVIAALLVLVAGCAPVDAEMSARARLSTIVTASIVAFDDAGGSETTSAGDAQYALIYDPSVPTGRQVVTADLADAASPAFGEVSAIAIHSMAALIDSDEFRAATVEERDGTFSVSGSGFSAEFQTRSGLVKQLVLNASASDVSQIVLFTYGITPEARKIFDLASD